MAAVIDAVPSVAPAPKPVRPRVVLVGTAFAIAGCFMLFSALLGLYLSARSSIVHSGQTWLPKNGVIPLTPANMALFTFLMSGVTINWAVYAIRNNDRQHAVMAMALTMLFGICGINSVTFLYSQSHIGVAGSAAGVLMYVCSGAQIAMTVAGLVFIALVIFRTLGGNYSGRVRDGVLAASLFWDATIAVYAVIWYAIFVTK